MSEHIPEILQMMDISPMTARRSDDAELMGVFNAIRTAQSDAAQAIKLIEMHQVRCEGAYTALNTKIDAGYERLSGDLWWLRAIVIALIAVEVLGVRGAIAALSKWAGLPLL